MPKTELPRAYDFESTEPRVYAMWEASGRFGPSNDPRKPAFDPSIKPFVISIPPPNITGELHVGHAMFLAMEDLMIRYQRMRGLPTLWVPGSDHAGIATQLQIEKALEKEGLTREQVGREEFLRRTWAWKEKYGGIITNQVRRLGSSCDWARERFTMDEGLSRAVREAFVHLYEKGLIYRGPRLINWSPGLKTAVSDLEVEYSEEPGTLYYFKYRLADGSGDYLPVATTRPETILADTAVAVHPEDERYTGYIGMEVLVPILDRRIPVVADEHVDREFGGGVLKVTPGHDPVDYEIGQRHELPIISVLNEKAHVNENGGPYAGLERFEARRKLWADMQAAGLTIKEEPYMLNIPRSQRGGEIIEPMISTQWFVKMDSLAQAALEAVRAGRIRIIPERFTKVYYNWLENIQDWCISRQLWWGHRIPVWYCGDCGQQTSARQDPTSCAHCGGAKIEQDPDVLDTWFSSALWPFSTLGWPEETPDLHYFYPTSVMETGYDILFFWVARMIMMGLELTGNVPFHTVYLHGLIRDKDGRKMSKSLGNVIDPLEVMDRWGTDALRFTLLVGSSPANDVNLSLKKVEANRNFANKVWNAGRFVISSLDGLPTESQPPAAGLSHDSEGNWTLVDSWIWARLQALIRDVERLFQSYQYGEAGRQVYDFFWGEFADWYVEIAKLQIAEGGERAFRTVDTLVRVLDLCLRMLHPFTPFVTEELWGHLRRSVLASSLATIAGDWPEMLMIAPWPEARPAEGWEEGKMADFTLVRELVRAIRNLRAEKGVKPGLRIPATIVAGERKKMIEEQAIVVTSTAQLDSSQLLICDELSQKPADSAVLVVGALEVYLPLAGLVDLVEERTRLEKELAEVEAQVTRLENLLASDFAEKAPQAIVQKEREKLTAFKETVEKLRSQLKS